MQIVEVQFIKDTQNVQTGNEFYAAGTKAHFFANQADVLVARGQAGLCSGEPPGAAVSPLPPALVPNYSEMTVKKLRLVAELRGVYITSKMRKADLIAALED